SLKTSIKTITYLSDTGCLEIQGASLTGYINKPHTSFTGIRNILNVISFKKENFIPGKIKLFIVK
ncbi:hypothetical protein ACPB4D_23530, partial [Escherichia coli]